MDFADLNPCSLTHLPVLTYPLIDDTSSYHVGSASTSTCMCSQEHFTASRCVILLRGHTQLAQGSQSNAMLTCRWSGCTFNLCSALHPTVSPCIPRSNEESYLDDTDTTTCQRANLNHKGSASEAVEGIEGWTWDEVWGLGEGHDNQMMMTTTSIRLHNCTACHS